MSESRETKNLLTEKINPNTVDIDKLTVRETVDLMCEEDKAVFKAISDQKENISVATEMVVDTIKNGGRIFFAGAGTSGRLGVLEAAECPPTFGTPPDLIQAVIAGGRDAVWESAEGAEDSFEDAAAELKARGLGRVDMLVGIAASSSTPFVAGAVEYAASMNCKTVLITCNPTESRIADTEIVLLVGPEVIVGSTRLKSATATKMVLNMITTTSMVQLGKTYGNLMVDLQPGSRKLRDRAVRIVGYVCNVCEAEALKLLEGAGWSVKSAIIMKKKGVNFTESRKILKDCDGFLYRVLQD